MRGRCRCARWRDDRVPLLPHCPGLAPRRRPPGVRIVHDAIARTPFLSLISRPCMAGVACFRPLRHLPLPVGLVLLRWLFTFPLLPPPSSSLQLLVIFLLFILNYFFKLIKFLICSMIWCYLLLRFDYATFSENLCKYLFILYGFGYIFIMRCGRTGQRVRHVKLV